MTFDKNAKLIVGRAGCDLSCFDADGVTIWTLGLSGGSYPVRQFEADIPPYHDLMVEGDGQWHSPQPRTRSQSMGRLAVESGANPDFKVTSATRSARELARLVNRLDQTDKRLAQREAQYEKLRAIKAEKLGGSGEQVENVEVIESETDAPQAVKKAVPDAE